MSTGQVKRYVDIEKDKKYFYLATQKKKKGKNKEHIYNLNRKKKSKNSGTTLNNFYFVHSEGHKKYSIGKLRSRWWHQSWAWEAHISKPGRDPDLWAGPW